MSEDRLVELEEALKCIKWDILGLSEVRRDSEKIIERTNGSLFYHIGETKGQYGVGFLINKRWKQHIQEFRGYNERLTSLSLLIEKESFLIVQVYAPTSGHSKEEIEEFYTNLLDLLTNVKEKHVIIMGDFNASVGQKSSQSEKCMGNHGFGSRNEQGEMLIHFASSQQYYILNSFFKKTK